jgi:hypothetical protein
MWRHAGQYNSTDFGRTCGHRLQVRRGNQVSKKQETSCWPTLRLWIWSHYASPKSLSVSTRLKNITSQKLERFRVICEYLMSNNLELNLGSLSPKNGLNDLWLYEGRMLRKILGLKTEVVWRHANYITKGFQKSDEVDFLNWPNPSGRPGVDSASNRNEYQESLKIKKPGYPQVRPARRADNLTAIY